MRESSEREVISSFLSYTDSIFRRETRFIGYNLLKFDVPFITQMMHALGLLHNLDYDAGWRCSTTYGRLTGTSLAALNSSDKKNPTLTGSRTHSSQPSQHP